MNNVEAIDQIQSKIENLKSGTGNTAGKKLTVDSESDIREFNFKQVEINQGVSVDGYKMETKAVKKILNKLRVRSNFLELTDYVNPKIWDTVGKAIKEFQGDKKFYAVITTDEESKQPIIEDIAYPTRLKNKSSEEEVAPIAKPIPSRPIIDALCRELGESSIDYQFAGGFHDHKDGNLVVDLLRSNEIINPFKSQSQDEWKHGMRFVIGKMGLKFGPFVQRLVCTNGMEIQTQGTFRSTVAHKKYDFGIVQDKIKEMLNTDTAIKEQVGDAMARLQGSNVSVREFLQYRNFFASRNSDGEFSKLVSEYFNLQPFYDAYGMNPEDQTDTWKRTADTGLNAYDFLNQLTWLGTHLKDSGLNENLGRNLQIQASNFFFNPTLDLAGIAEKVDIVYPTNPSMN